MRIPRSCLQPGAVYHLTQRGVARRPLFRDRTDRQRFLWLLGRTARRCSWEVIAYCLMDNHVHLLIRDRETSLSAGAQILFGGYARMFNERHRCTGSLYQGRYRAFVVRDLSYLANVIRYVLLNPVKAGAARDPAEWPWSSFAVTAGRCAAPDWLDRRAALAPFEGDAERFEEFVRGGATEWDLDWRRVGGPLR